MNSYFGVNGKRQKPRTQDSEVRTQVGQAKSDRLQVRTTRSPDFCLPTAESRPFLDVGKFGLFRLRQFVDFTNVGVGKFLHLVETVALIIFRDFFVFQHFL